MVAELVRVSVTVVLHFVRNGITATGIDRVEEHDSGLEDPDFATDTRRCIGELRCRVELEHHVVGFDRAGIAVDLIGVIGRRDRERSGVVVGRKVVALMVRVSPSLVIVSSASGHATSPSTVYFFVASHVPSPLNHGPSVESAGGILLEVGLARPQAQPDRVGWVTVSRPTGSDVIVGVLVGVPPVGGRRRGDDHGDRRHGQSRAQDSSPHCWSVLIVRGSCHRSVSHRARPDGTEDADRT